MLLRLPPSLGEPAWAEADFARLGQIEYLLTEAAAQEQGFERRAACVDLSGRKEYCMSACLRGNGVFLDAEVRPCFQAYGGPVKA